MDATQHRATAGRPRDGIHRHLLRLGGAALLALLVACGGGGGGGGDGGGSTEPPPPATVGADGGTVTAEGVKVIVPPGAMTSEATIRVAKDSTGAPALPNSLAPAGDMLAITPHGSTFDDDVTVRLPRPAVTLKDNQRLMIAKAQPGGTWQLLDDTVVTNDALEAKVRSFSFFQPVIVTYDLPPVTGTLTYPFAITSTTVECAGVPCQVDNEVLRDMTLKVTFNHNRGQLPSNCSSPRLELRRWIQTELGTTYAADVGVDLPLVGAPQVTFQLKPTMLSRRNDALLEYAPGLELRCTEMIGNFAYQDFYLTFNRVPPRVGFPAPTTNAYVMRFPTTITSGPAQTFFFDAIVAGPVPRPLASTNQLDRMILEKFAPGDGWREYQTVLRADARRVGLVQDPQWAHTFTDFARGTGDDGTLYRLRVCTDSGVVGIGVTCIAGPIATLSVVQETAPPIFAQEPRSVVIGPGQTASFNVVAAGLPAPTLQWQSRPANGSADWADVTTGSGGTTPNYTTPVLALADNGVQYRAVATNSAGSLASAAVTALVAAGPESAAIVSQPSSLTVVEGSEALFAITARGTEALSYAWSKNGNPVQGGNGPQLRIGNVTQADAGTYSVRVQNAAGGETSNPVTLAVRAVGTAVTSAPSIVTQPAAVAVTEGNVATFGVGVSGSGPISFQWRKNGVDIPGARAAAYTLTAATLADSGNYAVAVSNSVGTVVSQAATLGVALAGGGAPVAQAPTLLTQPGSVVVGPGMGATLAVAAQGSGPLDYQWSFNGAPLSGQTSAVLTITAASALDAGRYEVRVSNSAGSVTSAKAEVILLGAPVITAQPATLSATEGSVARFAVTATGDHLRYQWLRNNVAIDGAQDATYATPPLRKIDGGAVYSVIVFNGAGLVFSQGALLTVTPVIPPDPPGMALLAGDIMAGGGSGAVDGIGRNARLDTPEGLVSDGAGNLYVAESNSSKIARIAPNGQVTTILALPFDAYSQVNALALAPDGSLLAAASSCGLHRITAPAGPSPGATRLPLEGNCPGSSVRGVAVDAGGVIHLPITDANSIGRIGASPVAGIYPVEVWAGALNRFVPPGSNDGRGNTAFFNAPRGAVFGPTGDLFIADSGNRTIRRITPQGDVVTFAGTAGAIGQVDGVGANARFVNPTDLSFDPAGNLLVLDRGDPSQVPGVGAHSFVRRITPDGMVVTLFDVSAEALPLINPPDINGPAFVNTVRGITALSVTRIALSVGNAVLVRTLAP